MNINELASRLRKAVDQHGILDIGKGVEQVYGVSQVKFRTALAILKEEGYAVINVKAKHQSDEGLTVVLKTLAKPGTTYAEVRENLDKIHRLS